MFRSNKVICGLALLAALSIGSRCEAGIVISIDRETAIAGETILLGVYASSNSGDIISGFNLPFDYNSDGFKDSQGDKIGDLPPGFSFKIVAPSTDAFAHSAFSNLKFDRRVEVTSLINADFIATANGENIELGLNPTKLFDFTLQVASDVPAGTVVPFQIKIPDSPLSSLFLVAGPNAPTVLLPLTGTPANGSVTIVAVPEPSSVTLTLCAAFAAYCIGRRRLNRTSSPRFVCSESRQDFRTHCLNNRNS